MTLQVRESQAYEDSKVQRHQTPFHFEKEHGRESHAMSPGGNKHITFDSDTDVAAHEDNQGVQRTKTPWAAAPQRNDDEPHVAFSSGTKEGHGKVQRPQTGYNFDFDNAEAELFGVQHVKFEGSSDEDQFPVDNRIPRQQTGFVRGNPMAEQAGTKGVDFTQSTDFKEDMLVPRVLTKFEFGVKPPTQQQQGVQFGDGTAFSTNGVVDRKQT